MRAPASRRRHRASCCAFSLTSSRRCRSTSDFCGPPSTGASRAGTIRLPAPSSSRTPTKPLERTVLIDLYTWPTPNGHKIHIMLEETGLEYRVHAIDIGAGDQFKPEFLAISSNNKIPAMVDQKGPGGK